MLIPSSLPLYKKRFDTFTPVTSFFIYRHTYMVYLENALVQQKSLISRRGENAAVFDYLKWNFVALGNV